MKNFFIKYHSTFLIVGLSVFPYQAFQGFHDFATQKDGMGLIGGIIHSVMTLIFSWDLYDYCKKKRTESLNK